MKVRIPFNHLKKYFLTSIFISIFTYSLHSEENKIVFPDIYLLKMDSSTYLTNQDLKDSLNTIFINFSPTCDHCERTIKSILQNISAFSQTQFVLTSFETFSSIRKFYFDNGLNSFTNVYVGQEIDYSLTKQIQYSSFPCLILFDKNNVYIKKIDKESNSKEILKALKIKSKY